MQCNGYRTELHSITCVGTWGSLKYNYENDLKAKNFGEFATGTILYAKVAKESR